MRLPAVHKSGHTGMGLGTFRTGMGLESNMECRQWSWIINNHTQTSSHYRLHWVFCSQYGLMHLCGFSLLTNLEIIATRANPPIEASLVLACSIAFSINLHATNSSGSTTLRVSLLLHQTYHFYHDNWSTFEKKGQYQICCLCMYDFRFSPSLFPPILQLIKITICVRWTNCFVVCVK